MSSAFHTDSGTTWAHDGVAEVGREKPVIAFLIASTSAAETQHKREKESLNSTTNEDKGSTFLHLIDRLHVFFSDTSLWPLR